MENLALQRNSRGGWSVSGVFDLMQAYLGDGEADLSRTVAEYVEDQALATAFLAAYRARRALRPGAVERFRIYMLLDRLQIWEYAQRHGRLRDHSLKEWAEPFLQLADVMRDDQVS